MNQLVKPFATVAFVTAFSFFTTVNNPSPEVDVPAKPAASKIQVAILLDVSGSMSGLIEQAKAQLWNMVTTLGKAECTDKTTPKIELALYEYGRTNNDKGRGYVKILSPFTNDLDEVSKILFSLKTDGGDEYCGQVIYTSIDELKWDSDPGNYKVIFIAGNEDFLQGDLHYTKACNRAREKGVIVNTIYCGDYQRGIAEHWNLAGECGNGSFMNINHNASDNDIPTPYDSTLLTLNMKLNATYIGYGTLGSSNTLRQTQVDAMNFKTNTKVAAKRIEAKSQSKIYDNSSWDLVDATRADSLYYMKVDKKTLPDSLRNKTTDQLKQYVKMKTQEREAIQQQIAAASVNRTNYITEQKTKAAADAKEATLESAVEKIIKEQVQRFNMKIN